MPAGSVTMYDSAGRFLAAGANLLTATVKMALLTSAYTPNQVTHDRFSNVSTNQIAGGAGYISGGATLGTKALTAVTKGFKFFQRKRSLDCRRRKYTSLAFRCFVHRGDYRRSDKPAAWLLFGRRYTGRYSGNA
jgi:hypothetical protein